MHLKTKTITVFLIAALLVAGLAGCGGNKEPENPQQVVLNLYAPTSSVLVVSNIVDRFTEANETIGIKITYDDGAVLASKIEAGYDCDIYISDHTEYMDWLDVTFANSSSNPNRHDRIDPDTRADVFKGTVEVENTDPPQYDENDELIEPEPKYEDLTFTAAMVKKTAYPDQVKEFLAYMQDKDSVGQLFEGIDFEMID